MKRTRKKLLPVPWPALSLGLDTHAFTGAELAAQAENAITAHSGAQLLDWRLVRDRYGDLTMQVRYLLEDGIARYENVVL